MKAFFHGATALLRGIRALASDGRLRRLALAPVALTIVAAVACAILAWHFGGHYVAQVRAAHGAAVGILLELVLIVAVVLAAIAGYLVVGLIATSPFSEPLGRRAEEIARGRLDAHAETPFWTGVSRDVGQTLLTAVVWLAVIGGLFAFQLLVPVLAPVDAALGFAATSWFLARDAFDPTLSRHGLDLAARRAYLKAHRAEAFGLGLAGAILALIPIVGLVVPPAIIVAAAFLHVENTRE